MEYINLSVDAGLAFWGLVPLIRLIPKYLYEDSADFVLLAPQLVNLAFATSLVMCYLLLGLRQYLRVRGPLGALIRMVCAVGLGHSVARSPTSPYSLIWRHRLLISNAMSLLANTPTAWYFVGGAGSCVTALVSDYIMMATADCPTWGCAFEALGELLEAPAKLLPGIFLCGTSSIYVLEVLICGFLLSRREQRARALFKSRRGLQAAAHGSHAVQDVPAADSMSEVSCSPEALHSCEAKGSPSRDKPLAADAGLPSSRSNQAASSPRGSRSCSHGSNIIGNCSHQLGTALIPFSDRRRPSQHRQAAAPAAAAVPMQQAVGPANASRFFYKSVARRGCVSVKVRDPFDSHADPGMFWDSFPWPLRLAWVSMFLV